MMSILYSWLPFFFTQACPGLQALYICFWGSSQSTLCLALHVPLHLACALQVPADVGQLLEDCTIPLALHSHHSSSPAGVPCCCPGLLPCLYSCLLPPGACLSFHCHPWTGVATSQSWTANIACWMGKNFLRNWGHDIKGQSKRSLALSFDIVLYIQVSKD